MTTNLIDPSAGDRLKHDGMTDADENTAITWAERCDAAIEEMARRGRPFQASDLIAAGLISEPDKHQQWGPRFLAAAHRGVIRTAAPDRSKRKHTRRSLLHTWIGNQPEDPAR